MTYHQILVSKELGGAGLVALRLADELRRQSETVRVLVPGEGPAARAARARGLAVRCFDPASISGTQSRLQSAVSNLGFARGLSSGPPGIAHVHSPRAYRLLLPGLLLGGLQRVAHVHIEEQPEALCWAFQRPPHLIVTCARYLADWVRAALPPAVADTQWIEAVPNGVDTRRFFPGDRRESKQRVGAPADAPLALMLANLAPHKGQETAVRTVALLKDAGVPLHCWFAGVERGGGTGFTTCLAALIAELGVGDRVRLLGQRNDADVLLRAADFFLLPSTNEGLPLAVLEAQATGVPVLAAPTAGIPEVVADGETGFLIAADDYRAYASRIRSLLENPAMAHQVAAQAYARATREFDWDSRCTTVLGLYRELHERKRRPRPRVGVRPQRPGRAFR